MATRSNGVARSGSARPGCSPVHRTPRTAHPPRRPAHPRRPVRQAPRRPRCNSGRRQNDPDDTFARHVVPTRANLEDASGRDGRIPTATVDQDGLIFDVHELGPPDGDPVVLLHGFPQSARCWDAVTPGSGRRRVPHVAPDQRGYSPGARPGGRAAYRTTELVADAAGVRRGRAGGDRAAARAPRRTRLGLPRGLGARRPPRSSAPHRHRDLGAASRAISAALHRPASWPRRGTWPPCGARAGRARLRRARRPTLVARPGPHAASGRADPERAERDAARLADPAALTAALTWYRALPRPAAMRSRR